MVFVFGDIYSDISICNYKNRSNQSLFLALKVREIFNLNKDGDFVEIISWDSFKIVTSFTGSRKI